jgi:methylmalonyl-CoA/ethylmalonyl-CoA epimerase
VKFDHIGMVTNTLLDGRMILASTFEITGWTSEFCDPINGVFVQFCIDSSGICYELIAPLGDKSPVRGALDSRSNILNHVAYLVSDLSTEHKRLRSAGAIPIGHPNPAVAYDGSRIQFFVTPMRFILELIEAPSHQHAFESVLLSEAHECLPSTE